MKKRWAAFFHLHMLTLALLPCFGYAQNKPGQVRMIVAPVFNRQPLQLATQFYVNGHGDTLFIDRFRFYVTDIGFMNILTGKHFLCNDCAHLVDAEDTATTTFSTNVPDGSYDVVTFVVGVDSIANTNGANGGDLDPVNGMYWAWNSGYIMAKMEGRSEVCNTLHHAFEFHIGGYTTPYNAARVVTLQLPHAIQVADNSNTVIKINADAAAWFKGFGLAEKNSVLIPGKEANIIADNYAKMFSVTE